MRIKWQRWDRRVRAALWIVTLIGVIAALPLGALRIDMEDSSNTVEYVFDYRDLEEIATYQPNPDRFLKEKLQLLKDSGIQSMSLYESSLSDLMRSGHLVYYTEKEISLFQGRLSDDRVNHTYVLFKGTKEAEAITPIIEAEFARHQVKVREWYYEGKPGLIIEESSSAATLKTLDFDPLTIDMLQEYGFHIVVRFSDRVQPYSVEYTEHQVKRLSEQGVNRIIFDGDKVKGATDQAEQNSIDSFAALLNKYDIGFSVIENLKAPQAGSPRLAYATNYNVVRVYSLSPEDSFSMTPEGMADRFKLAAKDRNIRIFFLNSGVKGNGNTGLLEESSSKIATAMSGENGVINTLTEAGFPSGIAKPFSYEQPSWVKPLRMIIVIAAIAMITLLITAFIPLITIPVFLIGLLGSAALYVLNSSLLEQALALGAAVSGSTLGVIWMLNRIYARTVGDRRLVGGSEWTLGGTTPIHTGNEEAIGVKWIFPALAPAKRLGLALNWFIVGTLITLSCVPIVFGLLFDITYSLVIEQFRGVSMLHLAPLFLITVYVLLYQGNGAQGVLKRLFKLLRQPITLLWVVIAAVIGVIGLYYLSRTGNSGQVSQIEMLIRSWLESTVGVRPRFKEFMIGHPFILLGLFLALRYRASWVLIIVGTLGQLTMVSTFTHIHTPLVISTIRVALGLGIGIVFGLMFIALWTIVEGAWRKWIWPKILKHIAS